MSGIGKVSLILWSLTAAVLISGKIVIRQSSPTTLSAVIQFEPAKADSVRGLFIVPSPTGFWLEKLLFCARDGNQWVGTVGAHFQLRYYGKVAHWHLAEVIGRSHQDRAPLDKIFFTVSFSSLQYPLTAPQEMSEFDNLQAVFPRSVLNLEATRWWYARETFDLRPLEGEQWWKITVADEGLYLLSAAMLQSIGITLDSTTLATVRLYGIGGEPLPESVSSAQYEWVREQPLVAWYDAGGEFRGFLFYGAPVQGTLQWGKQVRHYTNPYAKQTTYLLSVGGKPLLRAQPQDTIVAFSRQVGRRWNVWEEDQLHLLQPGSGRNWVGSPFDQYVPATLILSLPDLLTSSPISYRFRIAHYAASKARVRIYEHNYELVTVDLPSVDPSIHQYSVAYFQTVAAQLAAGQLSEAQSVLRFQYSAADPVGVAYIDWVEISYMAQLRARDGNCHFWTLGDTNRWVAYVIDGFSEGPVWAFDVTQGAEPKPLPVEWYGGKAKVIVKDSMPRRIFVSNQPRTPDITPIELRGLRQYSSGSDVLVITHPSLLPSAQHYAAYRSDRDSLQCLVVSVTDIFNEFAAGMPDPTAIRNFIAMAFHRWNPAPRFVVLWGDGHYDYRGISTDQPNFVPPWESADAQDGYLNAVYSTVTEDFFVRVSGEDRANDLAIGRIAIQSDEEGMIVLDKIRRYENDSPIDSWRLRVTLLADDSPTSGNGGDGTLHTSQSERLASEYIPSYMIVRKIYLPDYPAEKQPGRLRRPQVTADLLSSVNQGTLLLNWIGHGNPRVWAHEEIFNKDETIAQMHNRDRLFFLTAATCDFARFDDPTRQSGGEELLVYPNGGAIAVFSAARAVYAFDNARLNERFYQELFTLHSDGYARLGEVLLRVKNEFTSSNDEKFYLLGDPLLRLLIPPLTVRIDTLNGRAVGQDSSVVPLPALTEIAVVGRVVDNQGQLWSDFDGIVQLLLFNPPAQKEVIDVDGTKHRFLKPGGLLSVAAALVQKGRFRAHFMIPKNIEYGQQAATLLAYAIDSIRQRFAKGVNQQGIVQPAGVSGIFDTQGPEITIYLDNRWFQPCDYTSAQPLLIVDLFDSSGINASGIGVGQDIQAWIDDNPLPLVLTPYYQPSLGDARRGTVITLLPKLEPGVHTLRVRAWDIVGNVSDQEICFRVPITKGVFVEALPPYPIPFSTFVVIPFRHSSVEAVRIRIEIVDFQGRRVWHDEWEEYQRTVQLQWQPPAGLPAGIYLYRIEVDNGEQKQSIRGTIVYSP